MNPREAMGRRTAAPSVPAEIGRDGADKPVRVAHYRTRWGAHEELETPRFHGDGAAGWDVRTAIVYRDWAALEEHADPSIAGRLFPDRERHVAEERRRFELLEAHWDVPLEAHPLPAETAETGARTGNARR